MGIYVFSLHLAGKNPKLNIIIQPQSVGQKLDVRAQLQLQHGVCPEADGQAILGHTVDGRNPAPPGMYKTV